MTYRGTGRSVKETDRPRWNPSRRIELLGWLRMVGADRVIDRFRTQKVAALLAYLAFHSQRSHPREELIEILSAAV